MVEVIGSWLILTKSQPDTNSAHQGAGDPVEQPNVTVFAEETTQRLTAACVNQQAKEFNGENNCEQSQHLWGQRRVWIDKWREQGNHKCPPFRVGYGSDKALKGKPQAVSVVLIRTVCVDGHFALAAPHLYAKIKEICAANIFKQEKQRGVVEHE